MCDAPNGPVDFDTVAKNARAQGIDLGQIAIIYADLSEAEKDTMNGANLITHDPGTGTILARFGPEGVPFFPEKATGVLYLGAD